MRIGQGTEAGTRSRGRKFTMAAIAIGLGSSMLASSVRAQTVTACVNGKSGAVTIRSSLEKGSCPKGTQPIVLNPVAAPSPTALKLQTLTVQTINVVDTSNRLRASVGQTTDGNVLTFFDSSGHKTLTVGNNATESAVGATAWDGNKIIAGAGVPRVGWGESNPNSELSDGFGDRVYDADGNTRTGFGMSYDLVTNAIYANNADGSSEGIGTFATGFQGYYVNDATTPASRQFGGIYFDSNIGGDVNEIGLVDTNSVLRVSAAQVPANFVNSAGHSGNAFVLWDQNGQQQAAMAALDDGSLAGFDTFDPNNQLRFGAFLTPTNGMNVDTYDASGNVTGHLP